MDTTLQGVIVLAVAAIPGVIVLEILEYGRPRLRDRNGARAFASYLILSLLVWGLAILGFSADSHVAAVLDASEKKGQIQVEAYTSLAWRLMASAVILGVVLRVAIEALGQWALWLEAKRRTDDPRAFGRLGDVLMQTISFAFAWDRLLERLNRAAVPQIVHVRFKDGQELFGILAAGGGADFQADGRGLVLDAQLRQIDGRLEQIPRSNGVFIASDAVASVAFVSYEETEQPGTLQVR